jgi:predicted transcriptional regulator
MFAKSLDVYVWLKLCLERSDKTYEQLGKELGMSASEVHAAVRRGGEAGVVKPESRLDETIYALDCLGSTSP